MKLEISLDKTQLEDIMVILENTYEITKHYKLKLKGLTKRVEALERGSKFE